MENNMAFCGLDCAQCQVYLATQKDDDGERQKVADMWSKALNIELKVEDINCDGCHALGGRLFGHCITCEVRKCGADKAVYTCAHCSDYTCQKLDTFLEDMGVPEARKNLENIKSGF